MCSRQPCSPSTRKASFDLQCQSDRLLQTHRSILAPAAGSSLPWPITRSIVRCSTEVKVHCPVEACGSRSGNRTGSARAPPSMGGGRTCSPAVAPEQRSPGSRTWRGRPSFPELHRRPGLTQGATPQGRTGGDHQGAAGEAIGQIGLIHNGIDARVQDRPPAAIELCQLERRRGMIRPRRGNWSPPPPHRSAAAPTGSGLQTSPGKERK